MASFSYFLEALITKKPSMSIWVTSEIVIILFYWRAPKLLKRPKGGSQSETQKKKRVGDAPLGSLIDSKCEFEVKTTKEQRVGAHSLARSTLGGGGGGGGGGGKTRWAEE
jgi:hypothetical protein